MSVLTTLITQAEAERLDELQAEDARRQERIARHKQIIAEMLPAEVWEALNLRPADMTYKDYTLNTSAPFMLADEFETDAFLFCHMNGYPERVQATLSLTATHTRNGYAADTESVHLSSTKSAEENQASLARALHQHLLQRRERAASAYNIFLDDLKKRISRSEDEEMLRGALDTTPVATTLNDADKPEIERLLTERLEQLERAAAERAEEAQRQQAAQIAQREQERAWATQISAAAQQYLDDHRAYVEACETWLQEQTDILWEPHTLRRIRYTTPGIAQTISSDAGLPFDLDRYTATAVVLDSAHEDMLDIGLDDTSDWRIVVGARGTLEHRHIRRDQILDETLLIYDEPTTDHLPHHRYVQLAIHHLDHTEHRYLNIPPHVAAMHEPMPAPQPLDSWGTRLSALRDELGIDYHACSEAMQRLISGGFTSVTVTALATLDIDEVLPEIEASN